MKKPRRETVIEWIGSFIGYAGTAILLWLYVRAK
jgi:hypothetical protein